MAAALNLLRALPLNPSKVLPPFAIQAQRTSSPLYSRHTKRNSCRCPFGKIFCSVCFSKILCIGFCENKKADVVSTFAKVQIHRLNPFDLIGHYSIFLTGSYSPFFIMSKTKGTNFFTVNAIWVNHYMNLICKFKFIYLFPFSVYNVAKPCFPVDPLSNFVLFKRYSSKASLL